MPLRSKAQRRFLWANHPEIARRFEDHTPEGTELPEKARKKEASLMEAGVEGVGTLLGQTGISIGSNISNHLAEKQLIKGVNSGTLPLKEVGLLLDKSYTYPAGLDPLTLRNANIPGSAKLKYEAGNLSSGELNNDFQGNMLADAVSKFRNGIKPSWNPLSLVKNYWKDTPSIIAPQNLGLVSQAARGFGVAAGSTIGAELNRFIPGADFHPTGAGEFSQSVADGQRAMEPWWKPQIRSLRNIGSQAAGGAAGASVVKVPGPWGAVSGAISGALKEPLELWSAKNRAWAGAADNQQSLQQHLLESIKKNPNIINTPEFLNLSKGIPGLEDAISGAQNWNNYKMPLAIGAGALGIGALGWGARKLLQPRKKEHDMTPKIARWIFSKQADGLSSPGTMSGPSSSFSTLKPLGQDPAFKALKPFNQGRGQATNADPGITREMHGGINRTITPTAGGYSVETSAADRQTIAGKYQPRDSQGFGLGTGEKVTPGAIPPRPAAPSILPKPITPAAPAAPVAPPPVTAPAAPVAPPPVAAPAAPVAPVAPAAPVAPEVPAAATPAPVAATPPTPSILPQPAAATPPPSTAGGGFNFGAGALHSSPTAPTSPQSAPTPVNPPGMNHPDQAALAAFHRQTGTRFDPNSAMDRANMQRLMAHQGTMNHNQFANKIARWVLPG